MFARLVLCLLFAVAAPAGAYAQERDAERDILVTIEIPATKTAPTHAPYRARKRYAVAPRARQQADAIASDYGLEQVDAWPIAALSVYCMVYRVASAADRDEILEALRDDARIESAQALNTFATHGDATQGYDDTYAELQHGLGTLGLSAAHRYSTGKGVRIAVIDSNADTRHEDLRGRVRRVENFADGIAYGDRNHGTAVTSVIAARANNARGMVGVAPEAALELYVACWSQDGAAAAVCDSFTLAQALDVLLERPPDVLNLSLSGPDDGLVRRLILEAHRRGTIVVAAQPGAAGSPRQFPANMDEVIAVGSSSAAAHHADSILAPGDQILVAVPDNKYDFRSGSSLAAAHVSGVVALVLALSPNTDVSAMQSLLRRSQGGTSDGRTSVNACAALQITEPLLDCGL